MANEFIEFGKENIHISINIRIMEKNVRLVSFYNQQLPLNIKIGNKKEIGY